MRTLTVVLISCCSFSNWSECSGIIKKCPELVVIEWMSHEIQESSDWGSEVYWSGKVSNDLSLFPHKCPRLYQSEVPGFLCDVMPFNVLPKPYESDCSEESIRKTSFGRRSCHKVRLEVSRPVWAGEYIYTQASIIGAETSHNFRFLIDSNLTILAVDKSWVIW